MPDMFYMPYRTDQVNDFQHYYDEHALNRLITYCQHQSARIDLKVPFSLIFNKRGSLNKIRNSPSNNN